MEPKSLPEEPRVSWEEMPWCWVPPQSTVVHNTPTARGLRKVGWCLLAPAIMRIYAFAWFWSEDLEWTWVRSTEMSPTSILLGPLSFSPLSLLLGLQCPHPFFYSFPSLFHSPWPDCYPTTGQPPKPENCPFKFFQLYILRKLNESL